MGSTTWSWVRAIDEPSLMFSFILTTRITRYEIRICPCFTRIKWWVLRENRSNIRHQVRHSLPWRLISKKLSLYLPYNNLIPNNWSHREMNAARARILPFITENSRIWPPFNVIHRACLWMKIYSFSWIWTNSLFSIPNQYVYQFLSICYWAKLLFQWMALCKSQSDLMWTIKTDSAYFSRDLQW
jgi:hypothetical protein